MNIFNKSQKGEITTLMVLLGIGIMAVGIFAGKKIVETGTNFSPKAAIPAMTSTPTPKVIETLIFTDDFEDGVINTDKWQTDIPKNTKLSETGGILKGTIKANTAGGKGQINVNSLTSIDGNFRVEADLGVIDAVPESDFNAVAQFALFRNDDGGLTSVARVKKLDGTSTLRYIRVNGSVAFSPIPTNKIVRLRLERSDSSTMLFKSTDGGRNFESLGKIDDHSGQIRFIFLSISNGGRLNTNDIVARFDNVNVWTEEIEFPTPTPTPTPTVTVTPTPTPTITSTPTPTTTPSTIPTPTSRPHSTQYSNLSATLGETSASYSFTYTDSPATTFYIHTSANPNMLTGVYANFANGSTSPISLNNPTKWDGYTCGRTLYWVVTTEQSWANANPELMSPIVSSTVTCFSQTPTPTTTLTLTPTPTMTSTPTATPTLGSGMGLKGEYYDNMDLTNLKLARIDPTVNFNWGSGSPDSSSIAADTFSVRWTGQVQPRYTETYTFYTSTDDGVRLWVNNQLLIDKWVDQPGNEWSGTIALVAGQKYDIKMEYFENGGGASATLSWSSASQAKEIIPQSQLDPVSGITTPTLTLTPTSSPTPILCLRGNLGNLDCSNDGCIDTTDYELFRQYFGFTVTALPSIPSGQLMHTPDLIVDNSNAIDTSDYEIIRSNFGTCQ